MQQRLNQETLKHVLVPLINYNKQLRIKDMVTESRRQELKARLIQQNAVHAIEIAIEKGEESAINYCNSME